MKSKLYIVHSVDTEGPLHESLEATFSRMEKIYGVVLEPSKSNLLKLQNKEIDLNGVEDDVAKTFNKHNLGYNDSWDKIDVMLYKIMASDYRRKFIDSEGKGVIYNWHCLDQVGFKTNERRKDLGFGNIFKHYREVIKETGSLDKIHWHFHPISFNFASHIGSTSYDNSYNIIHEVLCRRLIDHHWFPIVNRAGFHVIRQDSSFFLEQWIPFDYSNQSKYKNEELQVDVYRFCDWRRAPKKWLPYHPSYDDYQTPGSMNRVTTKCLNIGTRFNLLDDYEIEMAFDTARTNGKAILAFTNHDFRDMDADILDVYSRIYKISKQHDDVDIVHSDAIDAMQKVLYKDVDVINNAIKIEAFITDGKSRNIMKKLVVKCINGEVFGSQPYLALKTKSGRYYHDNLHEVVHGKKWEYYFDESTMLLVSLDNVVVASNDKYGNQSIVTIDT